MNTPPVRYTCHNTTELVERGTQSKNGCRNNAGTRESTTGISSLNGVGTIEKENKKTMIKKLSINSKLGKHFFDEWQHSNTYRIYDAYVKPSRTKVKAFRSIYEDYRKNIDSVDLKVISHNTFHFTTAYAIKEDDCLTTLIVDAPINKYIIDLDRYAE